MTIVKALKKLSKKLNTGGTEASGKTIAAVLSSIESSFNINGADGKDGKDGQDGAAGAYVTAIALTTTQGAVTGGTATLSDGTDVTITVTEATD